MTQFTSKIHAVVLLVPSRQNYTNHRHTGHLTAHIDAHRDDIIRKDHHNIAHSDTIRGACSGLILAIDPVFK